MHEPVTGMPLRLLRLEGAALLIAATVAYGRLDGSWLGYAFLFFLPDVTILGYLRGPRLGGVLYNLGHTTTVPLLVGGACLLLDVTSWIYALVWLAHIGFDRALGYGLKYPGGFRATHLHRLSAGLLPET
jgi:hypothetical protein